VLDDPSQSVIEIPVEFDAVGAIHISVMKPGGIDGFGHYLDDALVDMSVVYPEPGDPSYLEMIINESGFLDGTYESWCVDADMIILDNTVYASKLYSSYEELPAGLFENPENFDKVNYLLNNFEVGDLVQPVEPDCSLTTKGACGGEELRDPEALTYGDIQVAIWSLIDDNIVPNGLGPWWQKRVDAILCDVNEYGKGYMPACEDKTVFIVVPICIDTNGDGVVDENDDCEVTPDLPVAQMVAAQTTISTTEIPCEDETGSAWGDGKFGEVFPGAKHWGTYFNYDANCVSVP
jgi:hypothetical protein